jgi:GTP-binding protein
MVDSVLLLVDAAEGPMPQTRFVTQKAFAMGFRPIVVINKIDREGARPDWALDQTFELFDNLGATDEQLDFPVVYASAVNGYSGLESTVTEGDMTPLFETIVKEVPAPDVDSEGPLQMRISSLDYNSYVGVIGIARIQRGKLRPNQVVKVVGADESQRNAKVLQVLGFHGLERIETDLAEAGDIVCITGIDKLNISDTLCDPSKIEPMTPLSVDEPTISMMFQPNSSAFAGKEGKYVTSRNIWDRLQTELLHNVALRVERTEQSETFKVSGRGELHLSVLIENMRREGYEIGVGRPVVITRVGENGALEEPFEQITIDVEEQHQGAIMEKMGERRADLKDMVPDGKGRVRLDYIAPARGMIGFRTEFLTTTSGTGLIYSVFDHYGPQLKLNVGARRNGVLISNGQGKALGFALWNLQERGRLIIGANAQVYEGQVIGIHSRENDLTVNCLRGKQLTNVRASGTDENIVLTPFINMSLEQALEFIDDDELVEVTPLSIRVRKKALTENERKRNSRQPKAS